MIGKRSVAAAAALAVATAIALAASAAVASGQKTARAAVGVTHTSLGTFIVDANGRTLYLFEHDRGTTSRCYGKCATFWPPYLTSGKPTARAGVKRSLLGTTRRKDGKLQVTYAGHPLYRFKQDTKAGLAKGEGLDFFGGEWYVVQPTGKKLDKDASSSGSGSSSSSASSTGGYGKNP
jgi:predicted lipoprotein with Yx(FWY)xxD motif